MGRLDALYLFRGSDPVTPLVLAGLTLLGSVREVIVRPISCTVE